MPVAMFPWPATLVFIFGTLPLFLALPFDDGTKVISVASAQSIAHCGSSGPSTTPGLMLSKVLCKEDILGTDMEDAASTQLFQVRSEMRPQNGVSAVSNATIVGWQTTDAQFMFLANRFALNFHTAFKTWSRLSTTRVIFWVIVILVTVITVVSIHACIQAKAAAEKNFLKSPARSERERYLESTFSANQLSSFERKGYPESTFSANQLSSSAELVPKSSSNLRSAGHEPTVEQAPLPVFCPQLIIPLSVTRLAIPMEYLSLTSFDIDVLAISGIPLLGVSRPEGVATSARISVRNGGPLLAIVTPARQILGADGTNVGTLLRNGPKQYELRDMTDRTIVMMHPDRDFREIRIVTQCSGSVKECAVISPRGPEDGRLPVEHYELVANPGIDSVFVLGCFLALIVFTLPQNPWR